jgi:hypothetical protein
MAQERLKQLARQTRLDVLHMADHLPVEDLSVFHDWIIMLAPNRDNLAR